MSGTSGKKNRCKKCGGTSRLVCKRGDALCLSCYLSIHFLDFKDSDFNGPVNLPLFPTTAMPGTQEKELVFQERIAHRQTLHHPLYGSDFDLD